MAEIAKRGSSFALLLQRQQSCRQEQANAEHGLDGKTVHRHGQHPVGKLGSARAPRPHQVGMGKGTFNQLCQRTPVAKIKESFTECVN